MEKTGVVKSMGTKEVKTKFGMKPTYSFNIDGEWFSMGFTKPKFGKGDTISFDYSETTYGNSVDAKSVSVAVGSGGGGASVGAAVAKPTFTGGGKGVFPIPALDGQRAIVRQNALTNARELFMHSGGDTGDMKDAAHRVIAIARIFESYACGDLDAEMAKDMLSKKTRPVEVEEMIEEEAA